MAHLVRHRTASGDHVTSEVADLDAAVALVERLHNDDRAEDVRVFAEVPLRVQTYVKVSVAAATEAAPEAPVAEEPAAPAAPAAPEPPAAPMAPPPGVLAPARVEAPSADADALVDAAPADGRKGLFHR